MLQHLVEKYQTGNMMDGHQVDQLCRAILLLAKATSEDRENPIANACERERTLAEIEREIKK